LHFCAAISPFVYGNDSAGSDGQLSTSIAACQNNAGYPNFFGTSAATPHVAGIAALILQANSAATPTEIGGNLDWGMVLGLALLSLQRLRQSRGVPAP
jgi:subtilisin family serine protease